MVTPAECKKFQTVYDVCLNGYCLQSAEVNDVLPLLQDKDQNHDCRVDEKDYNGDSRAVARDVFSAKVKAGKEGWLKYSSDTFNDWTKLVSGARLMSKSFQELKKIHDSHLEIASLPTNLTLETTKEVCELYVKFTGGFVGYERSSAMKNLPWELEATTRQTLSEYFNNFVEYGVYLNEYPAKFELMDGQDLWFNCTFVNVPIK